MNSSAFTVFEARHTGWPHIRMPVVHSVAELDQGLVEEVGHGVHPLVDDNLGLARSPLDVLDLP